MRLRLELTRQPQMGVSNGNSSWFRMVGVDSIGRPSNAIAFGFTADNLKKELFKIINPTDDLSSLRPIIDLNGEWKDKKFIGSDGIERKTRQFEIDQFTMVLGPVLELEKIKRDSLTAFHSAEAARASGDFKTAYVELLKQTSKIINKVDAVNEIIAEISMYEEPAEFHDLSEIPEDNHVSTPEAEALKKFASLNGTEDKMELASVDNKEALANEEVVTPSEDSAISSEDDDFVFGEDNPDVLDDAPEDEQLVSENSDESVVEEEEVSVQEETLEEEVKVADKPTPAKPTMGGMSGGPKPMGMGMGMRNRPPSGGGMGGMGGMGR